MPGEDIQSRRAWCFFPPAHSSWNPGAWQAQRKTLNYVTDRAIVLTEPLVQNAHNDSQRAGIVIKGIGLVVDAEVQVSVSRTLLICIADEERVAAGSTHQRPERSIRHYQFLRSIRNPSSQFSIFLLYFKGRTYAEKLLMVENLEKYLDEEN